MILVLAKVALNQFTVRVLFMFDFLEAAMICTRKREKPCNWKYLNLHFLTSTLFLTSKSQKTQVFLVSSFWVIYALV